MNKGRVTLPIEKGAEKLVLELIEKWGADAIRNSDGTKLNKYFENLDTKVYSTYFPTREDQNWPRNNMDEICQMALMSDRFTSLEDILKIDPMKSYYSEQLKLNEDALEYMQVYDRTTNSLVDRNLWEYRDGIVTINAIKYHEYTVNFFAYQMWDITHMYNCIINNWDVKKSIPYDICYENTREHIFNHLKKWCMDNKNVDIVRFTTFFYHFCVTYNNHINQKYGDWFGYSGSVSPKIFELFEKQYGYKLTLEDIVDNGYYNNQFRNPTKVFLDFLEFMQKFVSNLAKKCVDIVHEYNKKAIMFVGDNWIGIEPYGKYFENIGLDGVVGSAECGVDIRMVSDMNVRIKEIRFLPYLFPDTFYEGSKPEIIWQYNWVRSRRAILINKVDRIGFGGYLSLTQKFPKFIDSVTKSTNEFRQIHEYTENQKCRKSRYKIAVLNSWGKIKSWQCNRTGHASGNIENEKYIGVLESLSGLPYDIEFINFEDVLDEEKLKLYKIIINVGQENSAFCGASNWSNVKVVENIRKLVANGACFVGIGDPSAYKNKSSYFVLSDILGVDKEVSNTLQYSKYMVENNNIINSKIDIGDKKEYIYATSENTKILQLDPRYGVEVSINEYGQGCGVYIQGLVFSFSNTKALYDILRYVTDEKDIKYISDNCYIECYEFDRYIAIVNNSNEKIEANISLLGKIILSGYELKWINKEEMR